MLFYFMLFYFMLCYFILFCFILFYVILFYFMLFYVTLFYVILFYFILFCYFILCYFILCRYFILFYFMLRYILFYVILFYVILCYFMLFYVILFYFILFYFILFYFTLSSLVFPRQQARDILLSQKRPDQLWGQTSSYSISVRNFSGGQFGQGVNLNTQLRLVPWVWISGIMYLLSLCVFMEWTWKIWHNTEHMTSPREWPTCRGVLGGCFYRGKGRTTTLLLVRSTDSSSPRRQKKIIKHFEYPAVSNDTANVFTMGSRNSSSTIKSCACAPIVFLVGVISGSVESTFKLLRHWGLLHVWIPGKGWKGYVLILTQYRPSL